MALYQQALMALLVSLVLPGRMESPALWGLVDLQAQRVPQGRLVKLVLVVIPVLPVAMVLQVPAVMSENADPTESQVKKDHLDPTVSMVSKALVVLLVLL